MISTFLTLGQTLLTVAKMLKPEDSSLEETQKILSRTADAANLLKTNSITRAMQSSIIAPMVVVEQSLLHQEYMHDLMTIIQLRDILAVSMHFSYQGSVNGIKIGSLIDSINPARAGLMSFSGLESFGGSNLGMVSGTEANDKSADDKKGSLDAGSISVGSKELGSLTEYAPLALGRVVNMETLINGVKVTFPMVFRQKPIILPAKEIEHVFTAVRAEDGFKVRTNMLKYDEITPAEYFSGSDQVRKDFQLRNKEVVGYYEEAEKRAKNNRMAVLRTGEVSLNTAANAFVISKETARQIELENGVRFSSESSRNKIFAKIRASTIVIVNEQLGVFTFYTSGASMAETYTRSDIKTIGKKDTSSNTLQDLMKLLNGGQ